MEDFLLNTRAVATLVLAALSVLCWSGSGGALWLHYQLHLRGKDGDGAFWASLWSFAGGLLILVAMCVVATGPHTPPSARANP